MEEYGSFVVEKRRQHVDSGRTGSDISDVVDFLLRDYSFQAQRYVYRVFRLCCLVVGVPIKARPAVTIALSGSAMDPMLCGGSTVVRAGIGIHSPVLFLQSPL